MSKRVTNVVVENCTLTVYYSDCSTATYDISNCGDKTPESKKPGDYPDPDPVEDVRCRVAIKVGQQAAARLNNYLSGIILTNPLANLTSSYNAIKLAEYGWSISLWDAMNGFYYNSVFEGGGTPGDAAKDDWDANSAAITASVQEALYCVLPASGEIDDTTREIWAVALDGMGTEFMSILADLLTIWPLAQLREMAFDASLTVDAVDCEAFDCGGSGIATACNAQAIEWTAVAATPIQWAAVSGNVDTSAWTGEPLTIRPPGTTISFEAATRNPNETWKATGAVSPGGNALRYIGIQWTPDEPCVVTKLRFRHISNSGGGSKMGAIAVQLMSGVWTVLEDAYYTPAPQNDVQNTGWEGSPVTIQSVMFIAGHYKGTTSVSMQITNCHINVD